MYTNLSKTSSELTKVKAYAAELSRKIGEMEKLSGLLESLHAEEVRNFLMAKGTKDIVDKIFASDEFGKLMGEVVPKV